MSLPRDRQGHILVPAAPFAQWCRDRQRDFPSREAFGKAVGVTERQIYRWVNQLMDDGGKGRRRKGVTETYRLTTVVQPVMDRLGWEPWMIYPPEQLDGLPAPEPYSHCPSCDEDVTTIHGVCPWCETVVVFGLFSKFVLERELIPERVVDEAMLLRQGKVGAESIVSQLYARAGLTFAAFKLAIRDEFFARGVEWTSEDRDKVHTSTPQSDRDPGHTLRVERGVYRARSAVMA